MPALASPRGPMDADKPDADRGSSGVTLVVRRTIRASAARLFAAWTESSQLLQWWGPEAVECIGAEVDLRVGGRYRIGNRLPEGKVLWIAGEFEVIEAPHKLVYTWHLEPLSGTPERVTVRFAPRGDATEVIVIHEGIASAPLRDRHQQGWQGCIDGLVTYLQAATR
jgi:uncharacterized protein YndB with AHSA1/START domain